MNGTPERGHLILIGGGDRLPSIMNQFISCSGGPGARVVIVPTASELPDTGMVYKRQFVQEFGCTNVTILNIMTPAMANEEKLLSAFDEAGGIFFTGGDQRRIIQVFRDSLALTKLKNAFARGATLGGTSAGTACMSRLMLTGDGAFEGLTAGTTVLWPGFDFLGAVIVDQHFIARQRQNRLLSCVLEYPQFLGIGIDEATAIWVKPDGMVTILGEGWVQLYDARQARTRSREHKERRHLSGTGLQVAVLQEGDQFDLNPWLDVAR
jgi:cyanophycinase